MVTRAFVGGRTRLLAAAAVVVALGPLGAAAQDNNNGSTAPAQATPPAIAPRLPGVFKEPKLILKAIDFASEKFGDGTGTPKSGFYPEFSNMQTGAGWISIGPGYRQWFANDNAFFDASAAVSWHLYSMAQTRLEFPKLFDEHLILGTQAMWQDDTQVNFFGTGPDSLEDDRSLYRFKGLDVVGYAAYKPRDWFAITGEFGRLGPSKVLTPVGTFKPNFPDVQVTFPNEPGVNPADQPTLLHWEGAVASDTRNHRGYPTRGGLYRAAILQFKDQDTGLFSFRQYEVEGLQLVPLVSDKWVLALRGWALGTTVPIGHEIPIYLQPSLGGNNTLRSFNSYRFHDNNLLLANAESRLHVTEHIDAAVFADAGNVANRFQDLNLDKTSFGVGLRLHTDETTFARMDVAHGSEGWRFVFRTNDPFRLARVRRHVVVAPFAP